MSIRNRIIYSSGLFITLFIIMGAITWHGNNTVTKINDLAYTLEHETTCLQGLFRGISEFIIDEGEPLSVELTQKHFNKFEGLHKTLMAEVTDPELHKTLTQKS